MTEFAYKNTKNASTGFTFFELNYSYYLCVSYQEDINLRSRLKIAKKLLLKLYELMTVYQKTFTILKNFNTNHTINLQNLDTILLVTKFG